MCLIVGCLFLLGPRAVVLVWWLADQVRWALTFPNPIVPVLGFLFLPWTTIIYVLVFPLGVTGIDWLWLALGLVADIGSLTGGAWRGRQQYAPPQSPP